VHVQVNEGVGVTPEFHEAEKFRKLFHKPEKIADLVARVLSDPLKVAIPELLPPRVELIAAPGKPDEDISVRVAVLSREGTLLAYALEEVRWAARDLGLAGAPPGVGGALQGLLPPRP